MDFRLIKNDEMNADPGFDCMERFESFLQDTNETKDAERDPSESMLFHASTGDRRAGIGGIGRGPVEGRQEGTTASSGDEP